MSSRALPDVATVLAAVALAAACSGDKPTTATEVAVDDLGALAGGKADGFEAMIVGSLEYGQRSGPVYYQAPPRYRIFKFAAGPGDLVGVDVTSSNGDAMVWVLDDDLATLAFNDDADPTTLNSEVTLEIPSHESRTHYIVLRDYYEADARFRVTLEGISAGCSVDADCAHLEVDAAVGEHALCDRETATCSVVAAADIACGGHSLNPHGCAPGWQCMGPALAWDGTGSCVETCGGFWANPCSDAALSCVDNPLDDCSVETGGADCGGICVAGSEPTCDLVGCDAGASCQLCWGQWQCMPDGAQC